MALEENLDDAVVVDPPTRTRPRRPVRWVVAAMAVAAVVAYVVLGFPGNGFPGRAGIGELHRVEAEIDRAYDQCGLDGEASINWFWGQVSVPSGNGIVGDLPSTLGLSREELAHATGSWNHFWLVCPQPSSG